MRRRFMLLSFAFFALCAVPARADDATATLQGSVRTAGGAPLASARVAASGPSGDLQVTDAAGNFTMKLPPGLYRLDVTKGGFVPAVVSDLAIVAGQTVPVTVTLTEASLNSLKTIGTVTATARGASSINTGAATETIVPAQAFQNLANPQINDVLQRVPDVTIQRMGSQQDTTIILGGVQPYETQVLIDGHPLALGQFGVWVSTYFPSYLVGSVETQSGPGNTTPFANIAVGGTVNLLTPSFTRKQTAELVYGFDSYSAQYANVLATGSYGNFGYVLGAGTGGSNGPYYKKQECSITADNGSAQVNMPGNAGIVQFCGDASGSFFSKGEIAKFRYNFTPSTSLEAGFVGAWGGYTPQGAAWGTSLGPTTIEACLQSAPMQCTNPANANLIGKTIPGYFWYPGSWVDNNQTLFDAQFRTSFGNNTLLVRPYVGTIQPEVINGIGEGTYPAFFSPPGTVQTLAPGQQIPGSGLPAPNNFESQACPPGNVFSFSQINSPQNTITSVGGQEECYQYPYSTFEADKLYGTTVSFFHPFGESLAYLTYDFHGQSTFAYFNAPSNISVPLSTDRYTTLSLTGDLRLIRNLGINVGLYDSTWKVFGVQPLLSGGNPVLDMNGNPVLTGLNRNVSRFDPHLAFVFHPTSNLSYRLAYGTSATFPFVGEVSGLAFYQPFSASAPLYTGGILTEKNPNLSPEVSIAFDLGMDKRFGNGSVFSVDLQNNVIHNVFEQLGLSTQTSAGLEEVFSPVNIARLRTKLATFKYIYAPRTGFGVNGSVAFESSMVDGLPASIYAGGPGFPVNNVQICGNGLFTPGIPTCIPYVKGYGQVNYTWKNGAFAGLGADFEGKNNAYFQNPFWIWDLTARYPLRKDIELQASVQNLFNSNTFNNLPEPNAGVPLVEGSSTGQTTYLSTLIPAPARTFRFQVRFHTGR